MQYCTYKALPVYLKASYQYKMCPIFLCTCTDGLGRIALGSSKFFHKLLTKFLLLYTNRMPPWACKVLFSVSIIKLCSHMSTVFCQHFNCTDSGEGPECKRFIKITRRKKNDSRTAHTYQEGKTGDSGPIMDEALMLLDGLQRCWGQHCGKKWHRNLLRCCVAYQHSSLYFAVAWLSRALAWNCSPWSLELWPVRSPSAFFVSNINLYFYE